MSRRLAAASFALLTIPATLPPFAAAADGACARSPHPEASARMAALGYGEDEFDVLLSWFERARDGSGATAVGYRLRPIEAPDDAFDVYTNVSGELLSYAELATMGITKKDWTPRIVGADPAWPASSPKASPRPLPRAVVWGVGEDARVAIPPIDRAAIEAEDAQAAASRSGRARRIGVFVALAGRVEVAGAEASDGVWASTPDGGAVWQVTLEAPDAAGVRVEFAELQLPAGGRAVVYNTDVPSEVYGPYEGSHRALWAATCFGPRVTVECHVPSWTDRTKVCIAIERVIHVYVPLGALTWAKADAGDWCWVDVSCKPEWSTLSNAVAGLGAIGDEGYIWCTGTLIVDLDDSTDRPLLLTAYHCLDYDGYGTAYAQSAADSLEVYWLYQTSACGGTAPDPTTVPRTLAGADFLAGMPNWNGNDFALICLRRSPPSSAVFAGWETQAPTPGEPTVCIQHPDSSYKRISIGAVSASDSNYVDVVWTEGVTAQGSSGAPLADAASGRVVGQLLGGLSFCDRPQEPDTFGRFDVTYPLIESFLRGEGLTPDPGDGGDGGSDGGSTPASAGCASNARAGGDTRTASMGDALVWATGAALLLASRGGAGRRPRRRCQREGRP